MKFVVLSLLRTLALPHCRTLALVSLSSLFIASCGGMSTLSPTGPSRAFAPALPTTASPAPAPVPSPAPAPGGQTSQTMSGVVPPLRDGVAPCWADRYPCEIYDFTLSQTGAIEVMVAWEGQPRALMVQLYWAGEGLAHESIAPRTGPSRINFRRPLMEAANYRLRVVSLEPDAAIPFSLTLTY
jgi:hypothetical protein